MGYNSLEEIYKETKSSSNGLSNSEAQKRLLNGKNVFPSIKRKSNFLIFLNQFKSAIMIILFAAIIMSLIIKEYTNIIFIGAVIVINTIIGYIQEYKAETSAEKLKLKLKVYCTVLRDGNKIQIDSEDIVVGDVIFLESGSKIPADVRLINVQNFKVDESILTGESEAVQKNDEFNETEKSTFKSYMAYAGTSVVTGRAKAIVVSIGIETEYGKIAKKVVEIRPNPSPLTLRITKFTKQISCIFAVLVAVISVVLYLKGYDWHNIFFSVVALTVSAIPEGLMTGMTISLSLSSNRMAKKNVIVKQLSAVEGLGSCSVIASDKTGTLTVNEQTAQIVVLPNGENIKVTGLGYNKKGEIVCGNNEITKSHINLITKLGAINNESVIKDVKNNLVVSGDSIDIAFKVLALKNNTDFTFCNEISKIPYESELKYSALQYNEDGANYLTVKGSVEVVLKFCNGMLIDGKKVKLDVEKIKSQNDNLASNGFRVIALAYGNDNLNEELCDSKNFDKVNNLTFVGLVGFIDPVRDDAVEAVKYCQKTGIKVCMVTGDHTLTALYIGKQLGIADNESQVTSGVEIDEMLKLGNEKFDEFVKGKTIFSRVSPLQKLAIVESFKRQDEFIAFSGDGVNDVLALKEANIGVSVGSGSDIAKETADMIIADDKFSSIVHGIDEGRQAYCNIRNVIYLLMSTGICEVLLYVFSIMFNLSFPLTAAQFLWLNLITNGIQSNIFAFEKVIPTTQTQKVRKKTDNIINKLMISECLISTLFIAISSFLLYFFLQKSGMEITRARSYLLTYMVFIESAQAFNCRNEYVSILKIPFKNNPLLFCTILTSYAIQICAILIVPVGLFLNMTPINIKYALILAASTISIVVVMEIFKLILNKKTNNKIVS